MQMKASFINNQSVKIRFLTTLCVNIARIGLSFIGGLIIARSFGPAGYGNYNFLLGSFASIMALFDMGTSSAFYTFVSQRKHSPKFYLYYFLWVLIQFLIVLLLISFIFPDTWQNRIWLGHPKGIIILAFVASFMMNKIWDLVTQAGESIRATVIVQLHNIAIAVLYLCFILTMFFLHRLTMSNLFIINAFLYLLLSLILAERLRNNLFVNREAKLVNFINEFKTYCMPFLVYGIVGFAYSFADVWLLQKFGGAVQQGFYSVGLRFSAICLIATSSMLQVFWKEIAEANEQGDKERLYQLYTKISRALCFIGSAGACFLIPFTKEILVFLLGPKYEAGWPCLAIMFLYPIYQSLGQINGSYYLAIKETKLYTKIGIIIMAISIPATYFLLAPLSNTIPGLALGSVGIALKMVVLQIVGVNVLTYFICKASGWRFDFLYQFATIGALLIVSFVIKGFFDWVFRISNVSFYPLALMAFCVPIYILMVGLIMYLFPGLTGIIRREQLVNFVLAFKKRF